MATEGKIAQIRKKIIEILQEYPHPNRDIQGRILCDEVEAALSDINPSRSTISVQMRELAKKDKTIIRVKKQGDKEKKSYYFYSWGNSGSASTAAKDESGNNPESKYEPPLAEYLKKELGYTKAISCGNKTTKGKWKNPDVVGVYQSSRDFTFPDEVVSAEIKISEMEGDILKGFGQACAYLLFSHKVYLVIPKSSDKNDEFRKRLKAMCHLVGLGLITFTPPKKISPRFSDFNKPPELRARKQEPDLIYLSEIMKKFGEKLR